MTTGLTGEQEPAAPPRRRGPVVEALLGEWQARAGILVLLVAVVLAVFGPWLEPYGVNEKVGGTLEPPSADHWLGTDGGGIDMVTLLIAGARISLIVGFFAAAVAMLIGGAVGVAAGVVGGRVDSVLLRLTALFLVLPDLPLLVVLAAVLGPSVRNIVIAIGVLYWTSTARLIRAQVKSVRERVYVKRARALGAGNLRLIFHHVLPQVTPLLVASTILQIAYAIFLETFVTFLGLGDPSAISWGRLIENSFKDSAVLNGAWWDVVPPGLAVTIVILACTLVGQSMEDALNPRLRVGHVSVRRFRVRPAIVERVDP